jgi:hypothetical protein
VASNNASSALACALLNRVLTFEKGSLPLCVSFRRIFWMTPAGRGWLEKACRSMALEEWPPGPDGDPDR